MSLDAALERVPERREGIVEVGVEEAEHPVQPIEIRGPLPKGQFLVDRLHPEVKENGHAFGEGHPVLRQKAGVSATGLMRL